MTVPAQAPSPSPSPSPGELVAPPGLKGLAVADTTIGSARGNEGFFHYRHRDATELARTESVESIWHLLLHGDLPDATQLNVFRASVGRARVVDPATLELVARLAECIDPPHLVL
jgi:citrate synthase